MLEWRECVTDFPGGRAFTGRAFTICAELYKDGERIPLSAIGERQPIVRRSFFDGDEVQARVKLERDKLFVERLYA